MTTTGADRLAELRRGVDLADALALFDDSAAVQVEEMRGAWKGHEVPTGHAMDGLLERFGWHGKRFGGPDEAHPLVFRGPRGLYSANPALVPMALPVRYPALVRTPFMAPVGRRIMRLTRTSAPKARLRMVAYRGTPTATMTYDALAINDHFRRLDDDTLLGVMDFRSADRPFVFALQREGGAA